MRELRVIEYGTIIKVIVGKRYFILKKNEAFVLVRSLEAMCRVKNIIKQEAE